MLPLTVCLAVWLTRVEPGDLATWVGALANIATLGLALLAGVVSFRVYKIEARRDDQAEADRRERAEDDKRSQAELISVWFAQKQSTVISSWAAATGGERRVLIWAAHILNASRLPVYDLTVYFSLIGHGETVRVRKVRARRVVPPLEHPRIVKAPGDFTENLSHEALRDEVAVAVEFRDAAGRRWFRDNDGFLHPVVDAQGAKPGGWPFYPAG
ncbi:hypothetical protein [Micromonospora sp. NPDC005652]|uniref:hypothetical protein n=1 Tax=Micromonospora sp. NPDC005652 TaxID=3157046 RepID=UPI0033F75C97